MAKIAVDCRMIECAGIGRHIKNLLPLLAKSNSLILLGYKKDKERLGSFNPEKILFLKSSIYSVWEQLELPAKIPSCDLFWSPHYNIPLLPIRAKRRLVTIHDVFHLVNFSELSFIEKVYATLFFRAASYLSDAIMTVSHFSKQEIVRYVKAKEEKIRVVYNVVLPSIFFPCTDEKKRERVRKKFSLPEKFILVVGNVKPHKNLRRVIEAFNEIECEEKLVIVGKKEGFIHQDDEAVSLKSDRVLFIGEVNLELPIIYSMARLLVFPSLYESFGFPSVEAMSSGCPVVTSHRAAIPEICGEAVFYVDPLDKEAIRDGIKSLLLDEKKRQELIQRGFLRAKDFAPEKIEKEFLQLIQGLVL